MRRLLISSAVVLGLTGGNAAIAGEYDGVWTIPGDDGNWIYIRHVPDRTFLFAYVGNSDKKLYGDWMWTSVGRLEDNAVSLSAELSDGAIIDYTVTFTSLAAATMRVMSCRVKTGAAPDVCSGVQIDATTTAYKYF